MAEQLTPMRKQYLEIKKQYPDCLLFFRLGDFYEMFDEDARLASKELNLTLTTRDRNKSPEEQIPMCGVPYHSYQPYLAKLICNGHKVAICEQVEDPAAATGIVQRDIIRIVSPGTMLDPAVLEKSKNNYIAAVFLSQDGGGLCVCDVSTGECSATAFDGTDTLSHIINELGRFAPAEAVLCDRAMGERTLLTFLRDKLGCNVEWLDENYFELNHCQSTLRRQFGDRIASDHPDLCRAGGALLSYLHETQKTDLSHIHDLNCYGSGRYMELDFSARRNLELTETLRSGEKKGSLLWVLDKTKTAMGGRLLRTWLERPLLNPAEITRRLQAVDALVRDTVGREESIVCLKEISDLERLVGRIAYGTAGGRDLAALSAGLHQIPLLREKIGVFSAPLLKQLTARLSEVPELMNGIDQAIVDNPPFSVREGGIIRDGYDKDVDYLRHIMTDSKGMLAELEAKTKESCGIKNLKIKYNKIFGYFIEVSKGQASLVPEHWVRKQTTVNSERFISQELKELEHTILSAQDKITGLEYQLFCAVRDAAAKAAEEIQRTAAAVAQIDVLCSLAATAVSNRYCMPVVDASTRIDIKEGRHPVVEQMGADSFFVPNDTTLDTDKNTLAIITGPNMAGKSTYMRQTALICLMAQMGSFVPAKSAHLGVVDRVFTRIGASDDLSAGQSTFMVEMSEVADILKNATASSLLILDEIGRGTSTYDGMSIARAVLEYCADPKRLGAKTLFATHYHELTVLEGQLSGVKNYHITAKKKSDDIIFLRKIVAGCADQSYGIEVAKLAGVPSRVITRAKKILTELESNVPLSAPTAAPPAAVEPPQLSMLDMRSNALAEKLRQVDLNTLTPIEAMNLLYELKRDLE